MGGCGRARRLGFICLMDSCRHLFLFAFGYYSFRPVAPIPRRGRFVHLDQARFWRPACFSVWMVLFHIQCSYLPSLLLAGVTMTAYAFGGVGQRFAEDRAFAVPLTLAVLWAAFAANYYGMKVAKWIS